MADKDESGLLATVKSQIAKSPCYRDSMISGITGGFFVGFGTFILTSVYKKAMNFGFGTFVVLSNLQFVACKLQLKEQVGLVFRCWVYAFCVCTS